MNDNDTRSPESGSSDDAFARLQAADPASGVTASAGFTDRVISEARDEGAATGPAVVDLATERERRRPLWQTLVGAAAAVAIVGGAGFGIGASGVGTPTTPVAAPPISLGGGTAEGATGATEDLKVGPMAGSSRLDMIYPGFYSGRYTYTASGLATETGTANAYGFDPRSASTAEKIAALAASLGVAGTPELRDGAWMVGAQDGTAPSLYVSLDGVLSFNYNNPAVSPWVCDADGICADVTAAPSEDSATQTLRDLLVALGYDLSTFELTAQSWEGSGSTQASAWLVVNGQRTDQSISIDVAEAGIVSLYGGLASVVELGEYSIVSEQEAFERLSDRRFGGFITGGPEILRTDPGISEEWVPPTEPPATPVPGVNVSWPVTNVEIVSARLGLASQWQPDGSVLLVPAYELTDADGGVWSVIALADSHLDFAAE